jgi:hypothetical protein
MVAESISPGAGMVGAKAGDLLGELFGWGDYEGVAPVNYDVNSNSSLGFQTPMAAQIPKMYSSEGAVLVTKREYIADINMTEAWSTRSFFLNPASSTTFPWLSKLARNFEQYKILGGVFGFRSLTANALGATGSPAMGSVTAFTQYDVLDVVPGNKVQANNQLFSTSCKPSESMLHPLECDPEKTPNKPLYTGVNELFLAERDDRLSYMGITTIGTVGGPTVPYACGELWLTYQVLLLKPAIYSGLNPPTGVSAAEAARQDEAEAEAKEAVEMKERADARPVIAATADTSSSEQLPNPTGASLTYREFKLIPVSKEATSAK